MVTNAIGYRQKTRAAYGSREKQKDCSGFVNFIKPRLVVEANLIGLNGTKMKDNFRFGAVLPKSIWIAFDHLRLPEAFRVLFVA